MIKENAKVEWWLVAVMALAMLAAAFGGYGCVEKGAVDIDVYVDAENTSVAVED